MDGLLIIDKPAGLTSHDVVARVRRILRERSIGHTGTLDPFATGVLVLLTGRATRLLQFLQSAEKTYHATVLLGYATDTGDLTGAPRPDSYLRLHDLHDITAHHIETALATLRGSLQQIPPMYSAKKVQGKKLYELARAGQEIARQPVAVNIAQLEAVLRDGALLRFNDDDTADLDIVARCSAGTYIRVLAEDLGAKLGVGAHLTRLRRTAAGAFSLAQALTLEELAEKGVAALLPATVAVAALPARRLNSDETRRVAHGQAVRWHNTPLRDGDNVSLLDENGALAAVARYDAGLLRPRVVLIGK